MGLMSSSISFFLYVDLQRYLCGRYFEVYPRMPNNGELLSNATLLDNIWLFINFAISCFVIACSADLEYTHSYCSMMLIGMSSCWEEYISGEGHLTAVIVLSSRPLPMKLA